MRPYADRPAIGSVAGSVTDSVSGSAVEFAAVSLLLQRNDSLVSGGITDAKGHFFIEAVRPGLYTVRIDFMGYNTRRVPDVRVSPKEPRASTGKVALAPSSVALDAVEIEAERSFVTNAIDKKTYDVGQNAVSDGGSATDVLQNVPSVDVDIDGNVSLRGSDNVTILIDGKPSGLTGASRQAVLEQIPASSIERIEVITNPGARYDPDGMSGIINVVLKKNRAKGANGSVRVNAGNRNKYNAAIDLNYRTRKFNVFAGYSINRDQRWREGITDRTTTFANDSSTVLDQYSYIDNIRLSHVLKGGIDLFLNQRNTFSVSGNYNPSGSRSDGSVRYRVFDDELLLVQHYTRFTDSEDERSAYDLNIGWDRTFRQEGRTLGVSLRQSEGSERDANRYEEVSAISTPQDELVLQHTDVTDGSTMLIAQLDYVHPVNESFKFETGYKTTFRQLETDFYSESWNAAADALRPDTLLNNVFAYDEAIHALYGIVGGKMGKLEYQVGLRAEQAYTTANQRTTNEVFELDYFNLFPSAHVAKKLPNNQEVRVSYSRRINRPNNRWLNPFPDLTDPLNIRQGNPQLRPEYIDNYEVSYARYWEKGHSLTGAAYYRPIYDVVRRIRRVDEEGVSITRPENLTTGINMGLEGIFTSQLRKWWNITLSVNVFRTTFDGSNIEVSGGEFSNQAFSARGKLNSMMNLPHNLQLQVTARYRAPGAHTQGDIYQMFTSDVALKYTFAEKRASATLRLSDVSNTRRWKFSSEGPNYSQLGTFKRESRILFVGLSYRFGQQQAQRRRGRDQGAGGQGEMEDQ